MSSSEVQPSQIAHKVLLIENAETHCAAYTRFLQADPDCCYQLLITGELQTGIELWRSQSPDVVLLDLNLPDGDGLAYLQILRAESAGKPDAKVPVIILAEQGNEQVAVRAMKLGAMDYLVKGDITPGSLRKSVQAVVEYHALVKQVERSQQQKELLSEIALRIRQSLDLPKILQASVDGLRQLLDCDRAIVYQFQPNWSGFVSVESVRLPELSILNQEIVDPCLASGWHEVYLQGKTSAVTDREDGSLKACYTEMLASFQVRANLVTPILQNQHLWGLLIAHECYHPRTWDTSEIELVKQLATQASIAIQQASAYAQLQIELKERREAEAQLQRLNQDLEDRVAQRTATLTHYIREVEDLYNNAPCGYHSLDAEGHYIRVNETELQWLGYRREEVLGKSIHAFLTEESRQAFAQNPSVLLEQGWVKDLEYEMVCKDGSLLPVLLSATAVKDGAGKLLYDRAMIIDIRDRRQMETALQKSQQFIQKIAEASPDLVYVYDHQEHRNIYVNRQIGSVLGYTPEELQAMGDNFTPNLIHPEDIPTVVAAYYRSFAEAKDGEILEHEFRMRHANGEWHWIHSRETVFNRDVEGRAKQTIGTARDVTDRKQFEQQLQQTNLELARMSRLKDEFLANMSHELRTPLTAILGMSDVLQEEIFGELNEKQRQYIKVIHDSGKHLLSLINDILDLAKIESGTLELQIAPVSIRDLCHHSLSFITQIAEQKALELTTQIPADIGDIEVDELRIRQALINLLSNAVKFTPEGGNITLAAKRIAGTVEFSVADTGIGIAAENMPKLFQAFMQIDSSLNREFSGTGLGLALIKKIVELHQGKVAVESTLGKGSCFTITLPDDYALANSP